jgi:hypothetical protein
MHISHPAIAAHTHRKTHAAIHGMGLLSNRTRYFQLLVCGGLTVRIRRVPVRRGGVLVRQLRMLRGGCVIALGMVLCCGMVRLGCVLVMLCCLLVCVVCHDFPFSR